MQLSTCVIFDNLQYAPSNWMVLGHFVPDCKRKAGSPFRFQNPQRLDFNDLSTLAVLVGKTQHCAHKFLALYISYDFQKKVDDIPQLTGFCNRE
jgi:hypothetical protein